MTTKPILWLSFRKLSKSSALTTTLEVVRSCHDDNFVPSKGCQNSHRQIDNLNRLKVHIVVNMTPFWTLFDNLSFCVFIVYVYFHIFWK